MGRALSGKGFFFIHNISLVLPETAQSVKMSPGKPGQIALDDNYGRQMGTGVICHYFRRQGQDRNLQKNDFGKAGCTGTPCITENQMRTTRLFGSAVFLLQSGEIVFHTGETVVDQFSRLIAAFIENRSPLIGYLLRSLTEPNLIGPAPAGHFGLVLEQDHGVHKVVKRLFLNTDDIFYDQCGIHKLPPPQIKCFVFYDDI
jgi:hypothetical protein